MATFIGCRPSQFWDRCPYLTSREDERKDSIYPACGGHYCYCSEYKGYCPVRDDNR